MINIQIREVVYRKLYLHVILPVYIYIISYIVLVEVATQKHLCILPIYILFCISSDPMSVPSKIIPHKKEEQIKYLMKKLLKSPFQ